MQTGQKAVLGFRPERLALGTGVSDYSLQVTLSDVVYAGAALLLIGTLPDGTEIRARLPGASDLAALTRGATATFSVPKEAILLYAEGTK
jgi:putative spermidine/putrescine transport system ATP-binding protein/mannopine transport system ATP-binding protein